MDKFPNSEMQSSPVLPSRTLPSLPQPSIFFTLPPELRLIIYEMYLTPLTRRNDFPIRDHSGASHKAECAEEYKMYYTPSLPSSITLIRRTLLADLPCTCQTIYEETRPLVAAAKRAILAMPPEIHFDNICGRGRVYLQGLAKLLRGMVRWRRGELGRLREMRVEERFNIEVPGDVTCLIRCWALEECEVALFRWGWQGGWQVKVRGDKLREKKDRREEGSESRPGEGPAKEEAGGEGDAGEDTVGQNDAGKDAGGKGELGEDTIVRLHATWRTEYNAKYLLERYFKAEGFSVVWVRFEARRMRSQPG